MNTTISIRDIQHLRTEARRAGDIVQVVACDVALDEVEVDEDNDDGEGYPDYSGGGHTAYDLRRIREILRGGQEAAWALCVEAISHARAQTVPRRLRAGDCPAAGEIVTLLRSNHPGSRSVIEWFNADGSWICPPTTNGYWYVAGTEVAS